MNKASNLDPRPRLVADEQKTAAVDRAYTAKRHRRPLPKQSQTFFFLVLAVLLWLTWLIFEDFVIYIITGVFVAVLALPLDKFWERFFSNRMAAGVTMFSLALIIGVPLLLIGMAMANDVQELAGAVQNGEVAQFVENSADKPWVDRLVHYVQPGLANETDRQAYLHSQIQAGQDYLTAELQGIGSDLIAALPDFFVGISVVLFVVYYVLTDGETFVAYLRRAAPIPGRQVDFLLREARAGLSAVFVGQILICALQGFFGGLGFWLGGVLFEGGGIPNPVLWGFIMALFALLPVVGTFTVWVPAGLYLLLQGSVAGGVFQLVWGFLVVMVFMDNVVKPKLIGKRADIHPMFVLVGVLGGAVAFGFIGLFLGPLLVGVLIAVLKVYEADYLDPEINLVDEYEGDPLHAEEEGEAAGTGAT
ncbi:MAG: hypothetical protein QOD77_323 [Thermoplasmata archaeon]|jgi:predicted PurR-regulated permease PerM|nr:hypothetical protein [Thermoplasmata archaeon]